MGLFDKKYCSICGDKIGLLGNRKLEDGNCCKTCANKLSPFFSERRHSTVEEIKKQLKYREKNIEEVRKFSISRTFGNYEKLMLDERAEKFLITSSNNIKESNPDVIDMSQVTGCVYDIRSSRTEEKHKDLDGKMISFNPPHYTYRYNFDITLNVNSPWFDEIKFRINDDAVEIKYNGFGSLEYIVRNNPEYQQWVSVCEEIKTLFTEKQAETKSEENTLNKRMECPYCGAQTIPDEKGNCEFCGAPVR